MNGATVPLHLNTRNDDVIVNKSDSKHGWKGNNHNTAEGYLNALTNGSTTWYIFVGFGHVHLILLNGFNWGLSRILSLGLTVTTAI